MAPINAQHACTLVLFVACILFLVTSISSPVSPHLSFLEVTLNNGTRAKNSTVTFGIMGHCLVNAKRGKTYCSNTTVGYPISTALAHSIGTEFSSRSLDSATSVMVLLPAASAVTFLSCVTSFFSKQFGGHLSAAFLAAIASLLALVGGGAALFEFVNLKREVTSNGPRGVVAHYGVCLWLTVAGFLLLLVGVAGSGYQMAEEREAKRKAAAKAKAAAEKAAAQ